MNYTFDVGGRSGRKLSGDDFRTIPEIWPCRYKACNGRMEICASTNPLGYSSEFHEEVILLSV